MKDYSGGFMAQHGNWTRQGSWGRVVRLIGLVYEGWVCRDRAQNFDYFVLKRHISQYQ